ncbi:unannotated protein [freshwater metagenome]|uniref:Unannotated protein n=1 Tax=freshwater metagenome TaxID=449393 RepID=A0A6J6FI91_9ZZZZ
MPSIDSPLKKGCAIVRSSSIQSLPSAGMTDAWRTCLRNSRTSLRSKNLSVLRTWYGIPLRFIARSIALSWLFVRASTAISCGCVPSLSRAVISLRTPATSLLSSLYPCTNGLLPWLLNAVSSCPIDAERNSELAAKVISGVDRYPVLKRITSASGKRCVNVLRKTGVAPANV